MSGLSGKIAMVFWIFSAKEKSQRHLVLLFSKSLPVLVFSLSLSDLSISLKP